MQHQLPEQQGRLLLPVQEMLGPEPHCFAFKNGSTSNTWRCQCYGHANHEFVCRIISPYVLFCDYIILHLWQPSWHKTNCPTLPNPNQDLLCLLPSAGTSLFLQVKSPIVVGYMRYTASSIVAKMRWQRLENLHIFRPAAEQGEHHPTHGLRHWKQVHHSVECHSFRASAWNKPIYVWFFIFEMLTAYSLSAQPPRHTHAHTFTFTHPIARTQDAQFYHHHALTSFVFVLHEELFRFTLDSILLNFDKFHLYVESCTLMIDCLSAVHHKATRDSRSHSFSDEALDKQRQG